jgi:hypothetical protein
MTLLFSQSRKMLVIFLTVSLLGMSLILLVFSENEAALKSKASTLHTPHAPHMIP